MVKRYIKHCQKYEMSILLLFERILTLAMLYVALVLYSKVQSFTFKLWKSNKMSWAIPTLIFRSAAIACDDSFINNCFTVLRVCITSNKQHTQESTITAFEPSVFKYLKLKEMHGTDHKINISQKSCSGSLFYVSCYWFYSVFNRNV